MAKPGSKRQAAIDIINANLNTPANDVVEMILAGVSLKNFSEARAYFTHLVENGFTEKFTGAPLERKKAPPKAKAEKAPKAKAEKAPKADVAAQAAEFLAWRRAKAAEAPLEEDSGAGPEDVLGLIDFKPSALEE